MFSEPLNMVMRFPEVVERTRSTIDAGHGKYSYNQPDSGLSPSWFAVMAVEKTNCGISYVLSKVRVPVRSAQGHHRQDVVH